MILERRYIVEQYCPDLSRADLAKSLYDIWTERYHLALEARMSGSARSTCEVPKRGRCRFATALRAY